MDGRTVLLCMIFHLDRNQHMDLRGLLQARYVWLTMPIKMDPVETGIRGCLTENGADLLLDICQVHIHLCTPSRFLSCYVKVNRCPTTRVAPPEAISESENRLTLTQIAHGDRVTTPAFSPCKSQ